MQWLNKKKVAPVYGRHFLNTRKSFVNSSTSRIRALLEEMSDGLEHVRNSLRCSKMDIGTSMCFVSEQTTTFLQLARTFVD